MPSSHGGRATCTPVSCTERSRGAASAAGLPSETKRPRGQQAQADVYLEPQGALLGREGCHSAGCSSGGYFTGVFFPTGVSKREAATSDPPAHA